jgi:hypothetical protein
MSALTAEAGIKSLPRFTQFFWQATLYSSLLPSRAGLCGPGQIFTGTAGFFAIYKNYPGVINALQL